MLTFADFKKNEAAIRCCYKLGLELTEMDSFHQLEYVARSNSEMLMERADQAFGRASSGEVAVLAAIMIALDYTYQSDRFLGERSFADRIHLTYGDYRLAVVQALAFGGGIHINQTPA